MPLTDKDLHVIDAFHLEQGLSAAEICRQFPRKKMECKGSAARYNASEGYWLNWGTQKNQAAEDGAYAGEHWSSKCPVRIPIKLCWRKGGGNGSGEGHNTVRQIANALQVSKYSAHRLMFENLNLISLLFEGTLRFTWNETNTTTNRRQIEIVSGPKNTSKMIGNNLVKK